MSTNNPVLLPCPFCGSEKVTIRGITDGNKVYCLACGAGGPPAFHGPDGWPGTRIRAANDWNKRAEAYRSVPETTGDTPPASPAEPVAWRYRYNGKWFVVDSEAFARQGVDVRPLYEHPPATPPASHPAGDTRPANCRFRLQDEGKPYPRSVCYGCGQTVTSGLGRFCQQGNGL